MNRRFKLSLIFLGVLLISIIPNVVNASSYDFDKKNVIKNDGETKIPIYISVDTEERISQGKISCDVRSIDVDCEIEPIEAVFSGSVETDKRTYVFAQVSEDRILAMGNHNVAYVILKNTSTSKQNVDVVLKELSINNHSIENISIQAEVKVPKKDEPKSNDATLKSVSVSQGKMSPEFSKDVTDYTIYGIADTINSIRFKPETTDGGATYTISGGKAITGSSTVTLDQGENKIRIEVQAADGTILYYNFTVYRGETTYNSARLESLSIGNYTLTPAFSSEVTEYTLSVPNTVTTVQDILKYKALDDKANVSTKGTDNFVIGTNTLTITVDNASGDETVTYKILINRLSEENIEVLKYINDQVTFKDSDGIQVTLKIDEFQRTYPGEYKKIINNEYKFDVQGNIIIAAPEDNNKDKDDKDSTDEKEDSKVWLIVVLVVVGLLIIVVAGILIFRKKDKPEDNKDEKKEESEEKEDSKETQLGEGFSKDENATVDIDEALNDLMNTKQYEFQEELEKRIEEDNE